LTNFTEQLSCTRLVIQ